MGEEQALLHWFFQKKPDFGIFWLVKACSYCGRDNEDDAGNCRECGTEFIPPDAGQSERTPELPVPVEVAEELSLLDMGFVVSEGFSRPDWKVIRTYVKDNIPREDWSAAWRLIAEKWLEQMARDLGGESRVDSTRNFLCLSDLKPETTRTLLDYAEPALETVRNTLGEAAWAGYHGKHVLLFFADPDDYFAYISFYYPEGTHAASSGVFLRRGYAHIALPFISISSTERVIVHELVHNLLCHLHLPLWLNEGLAIMIEERVSRRRFILDRELVERHRTYWNMKNLQCFWAGKSFQTPGEPRQLSYSLAQIFVTVMSGDGGDFRSFIRNADWRDAGQDAALRILNRDLGDVAAGFLGPGNWRPQRRAIAKHSGKQPA